MESIGGDSIPKAREKGRVSLNGITARSMKATGVRGRNTGRVYGKVQVEITTKGSGTRVVSMAKGSIDTKPVAIKGIF